MTRAEIRRRALRAAAAVSLTTFGMSLSACGGMVFVDPDPSADPPGTPADPGPVADAGMPDPADGSVADASDGGCPCAPDMDQQACCEATGWDFACGCDPWGPPMPPAMLVAGMA